MDNSYLSEHRGVEVRRFRVASTRHHHYTTALEACGAAIRTTPIDSTEPLFFFLPLVSWKNCIVRIPFGPTVDSSGYESCLDGFVQRLANHPDNQVHSTK